MTPIFQEDQVVNIVLLALCVDDHNTFCTTQLQDVLGELTEHLLTCDSQLECL